MDASEAIPKFCLGGMKLAEGRCEVLELLIKLLLDLGELLRVEALEVN